MGDLTTNEKHRIAQLTNILNEVLFLQSNETYLDAIAKETRKGIDYIKANAGDNEFFFPESGYMEEKISSMESSIKYIRELMFNSDYK